jgi:hypothetical protein
MRTASKHGQKLPVRFRTVVCGDSMEPLFPAGTRLEFGQITVAEARAGQDLFILPREETGTGAGMFKRLVAVRGGTFTFCNLNEAFPVRYRLKRREILGLARPEFILQPVKTVESDNITFPGTRHAGTRARTVEGPRGSRWPDRLNAPISPKAAAGKVVRHGH